MKNDFEIEKIAKEVINLMADHEMNVCEANRALNLIKNIVQQEAIITRIN